MYQLQRNEEIRSREKLKVNHLTKDKIFYIHAELLIPLFEVLKGLYY